MWDLISTDLSGPVKSQTLMMIQSLFKSHLTKTERWHYLIKSGKSECQTTVQTILASDTGKSNSRLWEDFTQVFISLAHSTKTLGKLI